MASVNGLGFFTIFVVKKKNRIKICLFLFSELDIIPYVLTLLIGLFVKPEMGMIIGTVSHLCILLYSSGNPKLSIKKETVSLHIRFFNYYFLQLLTPNYKLFLV